MVDPASPAAPPSEPARPRLTPSAVLRLWFSLREPVSQRAYVTSGLLLAALKYAIDASAVAALTGTFFSPVSYLAPFLALRVKDFAPSAGAVSPGLLFFLLCVALPFMWIGFTMSLRRAIDAGRSPWSALWFFVPIANMVMFFVFALSPTTNRDPWPATAPDVVVDRRLRSGLFAVLASLGLALLIFAISVAGLKEYGGALFFGSPLFMGLIAGVIHNKGHARSATETVFVALFSVLLVGMSLLLLAAEGVLCLAMAFPVAAVFAVLGALVGRMVVLSTTSSTAAQVLLAAAALPVLTAAESAFGPPPEQEVVTVREIDAPPEVVWRHVVSFADLAPPTEWMFSTGIAYPLRARIDGHGVGAVRHCEFSTGAFVEPITVWDAPRRLAFDVASQPKPMQEWSPYAVVNAPHLDDALRSKRGEFRLVPLDGGTRTRLEGSTWYVLDMAPRAYWRLWTELLLHGIHTRVLAHIEQLAEAAPSNDPAP